MPSIHKNYHFTILQGYCITVNIKFILVILKLQGGRFCRILNYLIKQRYDVIKYLLNVTLSSQ